MTVRCSPVVCWLMASMVCHVTHADQLWTVEFPAEPAASQALAGPPDDPFLSQVSARAISALMATPMNEMPLQENRRRVRAFFAQATLAFTEQERACLRSIVKLLDRKFGDQYPLLIRRRWKFIKTRADLCGGFAFTRGDHIILSEPTVRSVLLASPTQPEVGEELLLHEQMHVLQRESPKLFHTLYQDVFGFRYAQIEIHDWFAGRQMHNPDGEDLNWIYQLKPSDQSPAGTPAEFYWIGTLLEGEKERYRMGRDFQTVAVQLKPNNKTQDGVEYVMMQTNGVPISRSLTNMPRIAARFPLPPAYDHVNEIAAYLFTQITHQRPSPSTSLSGRQAAILQDTKAWFTANLSLPQRP